MASPVAPPPVVAPVPTTTVGPGGYPAATTAPHTAATPSPVAAPVPTATATPSPAAAPVPPTTVAPVSIAAPATSPTTSHLISDAGESLLIGILPSTPWEEIPLTRPYLEELAMNPHIRLACPRVDKIVDDVKSKAEELEFVDEAEPLVAAIDSTDGLHSIVTYTHDLMQPGAKEGNLFFEMNKQLRDRSAVARAQMMLTWGMCVHYTLKALSKLPDFEGTCYRGFPASDKPGILAQYKKRRPIQWGAFTSTTTNLAAARGFAGQGGVIIRIDVASGKDICPLSFFSTECEILLSPNHKFLVTSETGGYTDSRGYTFVDLMQQEGVWFIS